MILPIGFSFVATDVDDAITKLGTTSTNGQANTTPISRQIGDNLVFMFPGQGSQFVNMGKGLYLTEPVYRDSFDKCAEILQPHIGLDIKSLLFCSGEPTDAQRQRVTETAIAQPAICAMEYALAQLWLSRNVRPKALIGHSVGEFSAACIAGILSLEDAMTLVALRGQMMQSLPSGQMVAVRLPEKELLPYLQDDVAIGAVNSPQLTVISGPAESVTAVKDRLEKAEVVCRPLYTSHAFHSAMMEPILPTFREAAAKMTLRPPQLPVVSSVTGNWLSDEEAQSPDYWTANLRATVRFSDAVHHLLTAAPTILLEVGPGQALTTLVRQHPGRSKGHQVLASCSHPKQGISDAVTFCQTTGRLWEAGISIDDTVLHQGEQRRRLHLPGYPFERKRFWYAEKSEAHQHEGAALARETATARQAVPVQNGLTSTKTATSFHDTNAVQSGQSADWPSTIASPKPLDDAVQQLVHQQLVVMAQQLTTWQIQQKNI